MNNYDELIQIIQELRRENEALRHAIDTASRRVAKRRTAVPVANVEAVFPRDATGYLSKLGCTIRAALFPDTFSVCADVTKHKKMSFIKANQMSDRQYELYCDVYRKVWNIIESGLEIAKSENLCGWKDDEQKNESS